jgi:ubiquinone biosynthesis protein Coq4
MSEAIAPQFGEKFLATASNFYRHTVEMLFHEWWASASDETIAEYCAAIERNSEHAALVAEGWLAPDFSLARLKDCPAGSVGEALYHVIADHDLAEHIAESYRALHRDFDDGGALERMPPAMRYKVLRGHQTHDLHHVLTGCPPTPLGELAIQAFELAQMDYPYAAMWIATVTTHFTFVDPKLIKPAMDAIVDGWQLGRNSKSIQFIRLEDLYDEPLDAVRERFGLLRQTYPDYATPSELTPDLLARAA